MACILAANLWGIAAFTIFSTPGLIDRFGNLKGTDFVHFYATGLAVRTDRPELLYDHRGLQRLQVTAVPASAPFFYVSVYPPQSAVAFAPLSRLPYAVATAAWVLFSAIVYGTVTALANRGSALPRPLLIAGLASFPPLWQLVLHGQSTAWALAAFGFGGAAMIAGRRFVAGLAFGLLAMKPQLGLVLAVVLLASREWRVIAGIATSWLAQIAISASVVGVDAWLGYVAVVRQLPALTSYLEPGNKVVLMHSIAGLVALPPLVARVLWVGLSVLVIHRAWRVWISDAAMPLKMGVLVMASVLVSPHLFSYDAALLALAVIWIGRTLEGGDALDFAGAVCFLVVTLLLPTRVLIGVQLSVVIQLWMLYRVTVAVGRVPRGVPTNDSHAAPSHR